MNEAVEHGSIESVQPQESSAPPARGLEHWIDKLRALDERMLCTLVPILEVHDDVEALRLAMGLCPALANPGRALAAQFERPRDEFMPFAFKLRQLEEFLRAPNHRDRKVMSLDAWCRKRLENAAAEHSNVAEETVTWCLDMIQRFDPCFGEWLRSTVRKAAATGGKSHPRNGTRTRETHPRNGTRSRSKE